MINEGALIGLITYYYIYHVVLELIPLFEHGLIPAVVIHVVFLAVQYPELLLEDADAHDSEAQQACARQRTPSAVSQHTGRALITRANPPPPPRHPRCGTAGEVERADMAGGCVA